MSTLTDLFTNIANAIRTKKGTTDKIKASDFPSEIENLSSGGSESEYNAIVDGNAISTNTSTSSSSYILNKLIKKLPPIDTSGWKSMAYMFNECRNLVEVPKLNTENVTNMSYMFSSCASLESLDVSNFDTSNVTNMGNMFAYCSRLTSLDVSNFDTSKVTSMSYMFSGCNALLSLDVSNFDTSKVTNMQSMFYNCGGLKSVTKLNGIKVTSISSIFQYSGSLENFEGIENLGQAYTQKTANYSYYKLDMSSCKNLTYESIISIINNLYDLNLTYNVASGGTLYAQALSLGSENLAKLTEEEIAIATAKGWNVT